MANDISLEFAGSVPDQLLFNTDSDGSLTFTLGGGSGDAAACNSRAFLQADPLQLSIQQPFKSDTEPQQAFPAFLEPASDEEPCSLDLERLLSSFWQASLVEI